MKKVISIALVCLMLIAVTSIVAASNELEELVGLKIKVWQDVPTNWNKWGGAQTENACVEGRLLQVRGNWLILKCGKKYVWCSISQIARIEILSKDYVPSKGDIG